MQHKWAKEIKAWADGAEIECKQIVSGNWLVISCPEWADDAEYRIKPQPKEPQYLYVYEGYGKTVTSSFYCKEMLSQINDKMVELKYKGKIKLEDE